MADLYIGILIVLSLAAALACLGLRLGRRLSRRRAALMLMLSVLVLLAYQKFAADRLGIARGLPFSNVVILGNFFPPIAAFMVGLAWNLIPGGVVRRSFLLVPLVVLSWWTILILVLGHPPDLRNRWSRGVCIQTSGASCSAAAAATLLHRYQIEASESEMAGVCLTRKEGTSMLGLYRGLKLKTANTAWKPMPFKTTLEALQRDFKDPVILSVELQVGDPQSPHFLQWGWDSGMRHTVVLFRFLPGGEVEMGDPSAGRERWSIDELRVLWHGEGLRLDVR
jgi:hypothetical protein